MKTELRCPYCKSKKLVKAGRAYGENGKPYQRYLCNNCKRTTIAPEWRADRQ